MSTISANNINQSAPEAWETKSWTIRRPGNTAWAMNISTYAEAKKELEFANRQAQGHRIYAEQECILQGHACYGETRTVERGQ